MRTIGVAISTPGRSSLAGALDSIAYQRDYVEDVLVVGDGYHEPTAKLCEEYVGLPVRYVATKKTRTWGHDQLNYALKHIRGDYIVVQDDDDIFVPRALTEMGRLVNEFDMPKPLIGRVMTPNHGLLWQRPDVSTCLDGHCIVVPNDKKKLGWFDPGYNGDQGYINTTLRNYAEWAWTDRIWTLTRPKWTFKPSPWGNRSKHDDLWMCPLYFGEVGTVVMLQLDESDVIRVMLDLGGGKFTGDEYMELIEFAMYACQGKDCWLQIPEDNTVLLDAAKACNFKEHQMRQFSIEMTHDWPPPAAYGRVIAQFDSLVDSNGQHIKDWRDDVWGGRATM